MEEGKQFAMKHANTYFREKSTMIDNGYSYKDIFKDAAMDLFYSNSAVDRDEVSASSITLSKSCSNQDSIFKGCF